MPQMSNQQVSQMSQSQAKSMGFANSPNGLNSNFQLPPGSLGGSMGGGGGATIYDTLTHQQHQIADMLQGNVKSGAANSRSLMNNALSAASQSNPSGFISPQATAQYINKSVATPLLRQYDQTILPRMNDAYASVGALLGSRRAFANSQALGNLQSTIAAHLADAQQKNMGLTAQLQNESANRQSQIAQFLGGQEQGFNKIGAELTGQPWMAIQPQGYSGGGGGGSGVSITGGVNRQGAWPDAQMPAGGGIMNSSSDGYGASSPGGLGAAASAIGGGIGQVGSAIGGLGGMSTALGPNSSDANGPSDAQQVWNDVFGILA